MPEEKEYGYARDLADIEDPGKIPTEVTGNAIDFRLVDHPVESESEPSTGSRLIKNHDHILEVSVANNAAQVATNGYLDEFDAEQREAIVTASGSKETEESDESDDEPGGR